MYKNVLLPIDGSELSERALKECVALVKSTGGKVTAIHVISHFHLHYQPWATPRAMHEKIESEHEEEARRSAQAMVDKLAQRIKTEGVECEGLVVVGDHPYEEIIDQARKCRCDLIVMASHGHKGLNAVLLGSETVKVLTHSKIPVLVVR
jgi:nucleotide-binding universal stress UspA family protein